MPDNLKKNFNKLFGDMEKENSKISTLTKEQYLLKNVVQSFANKLYAQIMYLNK